MTTQRTHSFFLVSSAAATNDILEKQRCSCSEESFIQVGQDTHDEDSRRSSSLILANDDL